MHTTLRVMTGAAAAAILSLGAWVPAHADPIHAKNAFAFQIVCDNGHSYGAVANGNGTFTPAHDLSSTAVLVPSHSGRSRSPSETPRATSSTRRPRRARPSPAPPHTTRT